MTWVRRFFRRTDLSPAWWRQLARDESRTGWEGPSWNWKAWLGR